MKLLSAITRLFRPQAATLRDPPDWFREALGARRTIAGVSVNERNALHVSAVFSAIRLISETVASLPLMVYRRIDRGKERDSSHPVYTLLHDQPNPNMTAYVFRQTLMAHVLGWGNGYARILRNGIGRPYELQILTPDKVMPERTPTGEVVYRVQADDGSWSLLRSREVLHVPGLGFDGIMGYSVVRMARESLGLTVASEQYGSAFFGNNANAGGTIEVPNTLGDVAYKRLRDSWEDRHRGPENAHRIAILEQGAKFNKISIAPEDAQFLETRQFQIEEVARWFGVQPHKIGHLGRATWGNIEHQAIEFVTDTLRPRLVCLEQEYKRKLFLTTERDFFAEHLVDGLLRGDITSRYNAYAIAIQNQFLTPNEAREMENRNPLPGLDDPVQKSQAQDDLKAATARRVARKEQQSVKAALTRLEKSGDTEAFTAWLSAFVPEHTDFVAEAMQCDPEIAAAYVRGVEARLESAEDPTESLKTWKADRADELLAMLKE